MKKIVYLVVATILVFLFFFLFRKNTTNAILKEESLLIQEQIKNVGKLVVTEGHFSEVFNYKNSRGVFGDFFSADKKALVVVNADVTISYDLSKITYTLDKENKILRIESIPKEEITIHPDLEYYDMQSDFFNPFEAEDYNKIKESVKTSLAKKIENSSIKENAKSRLLSELAKFYIVTNTLGWQLHYQETSINSSKDLQILQPNEI